MQDKKGNEIDAIVELPDGRLGAFKIKLGTNQIDSTAQNHLMITDILRKEEGVVPSILCVICGLSDAAYKRPDGVFVLPITALND